MTEPLVSVVIPVTVDRAFLLRRALKSVAAQSYRNVEVVVVQDGPGQEVQEILDGLAIDRPVRLVKSPGKIGAAAARNLGVGMARGDLVAFLDSDDEWLPRKLEKQIACFLDPAVGAVGCESLMKDDRSGRVVEKQTPPLRGEVFQQLLLTGAGVQTSMLAVRRKAFQQVGGFNGRLSFAEEKDLALRLARICRFGWISEPLGVQHFNHGLVQGSLDPDNVIRGIRAFAAIWEGEARSRFGIEGVRWLHRWLYGYAINARKRQLESGRSVAERWSVLRAITREEWRHIDWVERGKMAILVALGGNAARVWRKLAWRLGERHR
jgi:glycosyltransferase involved in cell wall biosynthesis